MKCDHCDNPAVVHEVTIVDGKQREVHLCLEHAQAAGVHVPGTPPISKLMTQFTTVAGTSGSKSGRRKPLTCPGCGLTLLGFRKQTLTGCATCYDAFGSAFEQLVERAQHGGMRHVGKMPAAMGPAVERRRHMQQLLMDLDAAVGAEEYERAAAIRDELAVLNDERGSA